MFKELKYIIIGGLAGAFLSLALFASGSLVGPDYGPATPGSLCLIDDDTWVFCDSTMTFGDATEPILSITADDITITGSINTGITNHHVVFSDVGVLAGEARLTYDDETDTLEAWIMSTTALTITGWNEGEIPFMNGSSRLINDADFNFVTGTNTLNVPNIISSGTIQAEQLTSTDDITMQGHLFTMGNNTSADDIVLSFLSNANDATITFDVSEDDFLFGNANIYTTGAIQSVILTDGSATLSSGNLIDMGNITGTDVDISAGTGDFSTTGTLGAGATTLSGNLKINSGLLHIEKDQDAITEIRIDNDTEGTGEVTHGFTFYDGASKVASMERINNGATTVINNTGGLLQLKTTTAGDILLSPYGVVYLNDDKRLAFGGQADTDSYITWDNSNLELDIYSSGAVNFGTSNLTTTGTAFLGLIDLGTNTIDDTAFTGDWAFNSGNLSDVGTLGAGAITGTSITDGTATLDDGALTEITTIGMSGQLTNTLAIGTSPFAITSTTVNTNLNADLWDGYQFSDYLDQSVKTTSTPTFAGALFTDKVKFTQTDGNEYIDSLADGYMDYGATTQHRFNNTIDITTTNNPQLRLTHTDGADETDFYVNADGNLLITPTSRTMYLGDATNGDSMFGFYGDTTIYTLYHDEDNGNLKVSANDSTNYAKFEDDGSLVFAGTAGLSFGDLSVYNNTTADSIATATWTQLTRFDTAGASNNTTVSTANDDITILKAGKYMITMSSAFSGTGNVTWTGGVWKNNGATQLTNLQTHRKLGASGDVGSVSVSGIADLSVNDTIEVWFQQSEGVNKDITVKDCTLSVVQIGG